MQIGPKIIRAEEAVGRYVQKGFEKASTKIKSVEIPNIIERIPAPVRTATKFTAGNIFAGWYSIMCGAVGLPAAKILEHVSRALGGETLAEISKEAASHENIIRVTREAYDAFGVPKSGEFMTQDIRKSISGAKTAIKNLIKK